MIFSHRKKSENKVFNEDPNIASVEKNTGIDFSNVKIHYASTEPDKYEAAAFTRGNHIHIKQGKTHFIPHELGHVVQQRRGIVKPTGIVNGVKINQDKRMEESANAALNKKVSVNTHISTDIIQLGREHVATIYTFRHQPHKAQYASNHEKQALIDAEVHEALSEIAGNQNIEVLDAARDDIIKNRKEDAFIDEEVNEEANYEELERSMTASQQLDFFGTVPPTVEQGNLENPQVKQVAIITDINQDILSSIVKKRLYGPHTIANVFLDLMVELYDTVNIFNEQIRPYPVERVQEIIIQEIPDLNQEIQGILAPYLYYYADLYKEALGITETLDRLVSQFESNREQIAVLCTTLQDITYKLLNLNPYAVYGWNTTEKASNDNLKGKGESTIATSLRYIYELFNGKLLVVPPYVLKRIIDCGEKFLNKENYKEFVQLRLKDIAFSEVTLESVSSLNNDFIMIEKMLIFYNTIYYNKVALTILEHAFILNRLIQAINNPIEDNHGLIYYLFDTIKGNINLPIDYIIHPLKEILSFVPPIDYYDIKIANMEEMDENEMQIFEMDEEKIDVIQKQQLYEENLGTILKYLTYQFLIYREEYYENVNLITEPVVDNATNTLIKELQKADAAITANEDYEFFFAIVDRAELPLLLKSATSPFQPALHRTYNQIVKMIKNLISALNSNEEEEA